VRDGRTQSSSTASFARSLHRRSFAWVFARRLDDGGYQNRDDADDDGAGDDDGASGERWFEANDADDERCADATRGVDGVCAAVFVVVVVAMREESGARRTGRGRRRRGGGESSAFGR
jgi:hypothetical protein